MICMIKRAYSNLQHFPVIVLNIPRSDQMSRFSTICLNLEGLYKAKFVQWMTAAVKDHSTTVKIFYCNLTQLLNYHSQSSLNRYFVLYILYGMNKRVLTKPMKNDF